MIKIFLSILIILYSHSVSAVILENNNFKQADLDSLQNETTVFQSIGQGIALSLAQCELADLCTLTVEEKELQELIKALDSRIESLVLRQEEAEDPVGLDNVLTAYITERDNYNSHLEKLRSITSTLDAESGLLDESIELEPEPDFSVESARNAELMEYVEDELELFEDDELLDDEDLEDLPEIPENP